MSEASRIVGVNFHLVVIGRHYASALVPAKAELRNSMSLIKYANFSRLHHLHCIILEINMRDSYYDPPSHNITLPITSGNMCLIIKNQLFESRRNSSLAITDLNLVQL